MNSAMNYSAISNSATSPSFVTNSAQLLAPDYCDTRDLVVALNDARLALNRALAIAQQCETHSPRRYAGLAANLAQGKTHLDWSARRFRTGSAS